MFQYLPSEVLLPAPLRTACRLNLDPPLIDYLDLQITRQS